jgi:cytochrome c biogenesis protein CcmG/thiol:disulfide interchange protein DsbE
MALAILLAGLAGQARGQDPFKALDLIRPNRRTAAPDFAAAGLSAPARRLADFRGRVVFLNFWATWCLPCKEEMPSMERLYGQHKEQGLTVIAVSMDTGEPRAVSSFAKSLGLTFPIALDPRMEVADRYKVRALPTSFLIDRQGDVVAIALGPRDWGSPAAHAIIASLLK